MDFTFYPFIAAFPAILMWHSCPFWIKHCECRLFYYLPSRFLILVSLPIIHALHIYHRRMFTNTSAHPIIIEIMSINLLYVFHTRTSPYFILCTIFIKACPFLPQVKSAFIEQNFIFDVSFLIGSCNNCLNVPSLKYFMLWYAEARIRM